MTLKVKTQTEINATAKQVWEKLLQFENFGQWNELVFSVKGTAKVGATLNLKLRMGRKTVGSKAKILAATENENLTWKGGISIPGLFVGEHYFKIEKISQNKVRFIHGETFNGVLVPVLFKDPSTITGKYQEATDNFKSFVENGVGIPKMKAVVINSYGALKDVLETVQIKLPKVKDNDVLIEVISSSVNPLDFKIAKGAMKQVLNKKFPKTMGHDVSGTVVKVGKNVTQFKKGDQVYSRVDTRRFGTFAEFCVAQAVNVAFKPKNLSHQEAASIPLVALTSWQALTEQLKTKSGDKVLIQAGSGGIGTVAIQLAKILGAHVATTTSTNNIDLVKGLGADVVVDYRKENFEDVLSDYDGVYDTMGAIANGFKILKKGGVLTTIVGAPTHTWAKEEGMPKIVQGFLFMANLKHNTLAKKLGVTYAPFLMVSQGEQLTQIGKYIEEGKVKPVIDKEFSLDQILEALEYSASGRAKGKIVINVKS